MNNSSFQKILLFFLFAFSIYCALKIGQSWDEEFHLIQGKITLDYLFSLGKIDIDILYYGDFIMESAQLTIPHIGTYDRDFLTNCMCDLDEDFVHPKLKKSMKELLTKE